LIFYLDGTLGDVPATDTAKHVGDTLLGLTSLVVRERPHDLSLTAVSTMGTLERCGPKPLTLLAACEGITQPSMTSLVTQLEARGLVERRRDPGDARVALVALTREGVQYRHAARQGFFDRLSSLIGQLEPDEAGALVAAIPVLERLLDLADRSAALPAKSQRQEPVS
jgi:DNA-binding MarR family transcriptional regulator